jgi:hypothetical protein
VATSLNNVSVTLRSLGRRAEALRRQEEADAMGVRLGDPRAWMWSVNLGLLLLREGRSRAAIEPLERSVASLEAVRSDARSLLGEARSQLMGAVREWADPYVALVQARLALSETDAAFETLERGRGRELLDLLLQGGEDPVRTATARGRAGGVDLASLEVALRRRDAAEREVAMHSATVQRAPSDLPLEARRGLRAAETAARLELLQALAEVHRRVQVVLPEARPHSASDVKALLAPEERLLAYSLGPDACHVFVVSSAGIAAEPLVRGGRAVTEREVDALVAAYREVLTRRSSDVATQVAPAGKDLFAAIVPAKAWEAVRQASRVYLLADGALGALPFETLVVGDVGRTPLFWADAGPPVAYEPSASALASLRTRAAAPPDALDLVAVGDPAFAGHDVRPEWPAKGVLVTEVRPGGGASRVGLRPGDVLVAYDGAEVGDPAALRAGVTAAGEGRSDVPLEFVRGGERHRAQVSSGLLGVGIAAESPVVAGPRLVERGPLAIALRSASERARRFSPLPGSRAEVEAIVATVRARRGRDARIRTLLGRAATEAGLFEAAANPSVLHLATHGIVDETETASFSALALTMPALPAPGDDGFLTLADLFSRWHGRLAGTQLVVLSACESTKGKRRRGEGMYALPWGFLFSGARAVVGSLWRVDDASTSFLMSRFYAQLYGADGLDPLAALDRARRDTKAKHPHPYDWGPFVFSGAPR